MTTSALRQWWQALETQWKHAFHEGVWGRPATEEIPTDEELQELINIEVLRFVGPTGPYSNLSFELTNLSGLAELKKVFLLVVTYHQVDSLLPLSNLRALKSLFIHDNQIRTLRGLEEVKCLEKLIIHANKLVSIKEVAELPQLKELYVNGNQLTSFEGLGAQHDGNLEAFYALPNPVKEREVMRIEREVGVRCRRV